MTENPVIKFVNHASYIIEYKNIKLLVDPWLSGSAFNDGWSLLSKTNISKNLLQEITHIWISHEHPDHFSIKDLLYIKSINKKNVEVLFQKTKDKRVINFLKKKSFKTKEMEDGFDYKILDDFTIKVKTIPSFDSLSIMNVKDKTIVNFNDCILSKIGLKKIRKLISKCDLLFTQFSYASWIGKPNEKEKREIASKEKLMQIEDQIDHLKPKVVIPFASFMFFSHEENFYMNDSINNLQKIENLITKKNSKAVILYPGAEYNFKNNFLSNKENISKYEYDFNSIKSKELLKSETITEDQLFISSQKYVNKIIKKNGFFLLFIFYYFSKISKIGLKRDLLGFGGVSIFLTDLKKIYNFNFIKGMKINNKQNYDVAISSQSLEYIFQNDWGIGSIMINGRGSYKNEYSKWIFIRIFSLGLINSNGQSLLKKVIQRLLFKGNKLNETEPSFLKNN